MSQQISTLGYKIVQGKYNSMEPEMKNVGNILYRTYPLCRVCRGDRYIFIINNILKIKYRELYMLSTTLGLKTLRDNKL